MNSEKKNSIPSGSNLSGSPKKGVVRQTRRSVDDLKCTLKLETEELKVLNYSAFGIAVITKQALPTGTIFKDCKLSMEDSLSQDLDLRVVRSEEFNAGEFKTGFEVVGIPINVDRFSVFPEIWRTVDAVLLDDQHMQKLPQKFISSVFRLKENLSKLEQKIIEMEKKQEFLSWSQKEDFDETVIQVAGNAIQQVWSVCHTEISAAVENLDEVGAKEAFSFFREQMRDLLYQSPFANRTFTKPRGYAGDFEMMNLIYRDQNFGRGLFARCVEHSFLTCPEPQAVRNRVGYLLDALKRTLTIRKTDKVRILSVACGPAFEIQKLLHDGDQETLDRLEIFLLDQDEGSLQHAQRNIKTLAQSLGKNLNVTYLHKTIKEVIVSGLPMGDFDLIYSAGLFDYFTDPVAQQAAKVLLNLLKPEAELVIGNFDVSTPNKFTMSLVFDWNLIYRSRADLERIFSFPSVKLTIDQEKMGVNLFCILRK